MRGFQLPNDALGDGATTLTRSPRVARLSARKRFILTDTDANLNAILDSVTFGSQTTDRSYGRTAYDADVWTITNPTPGGANP